MKRVTTLIGVLGVLGLLGVSGCGSSGKHSTTSAASAERTRLIAQLRTMLEGPSSPLAGAPDLDACVLHQANGLPLRTVRILASSQPDRAVADPVLARCVAQGKGLSFFRRQISTSATGQLQASASPRFLRCMAGGVDRLSPAQLAAALNKQATGDQTYALRLGQGIALGCIQQPGIFEQYRKQWLIGLRGGLERRHAPPAFVRCVVNKASHIGPAELTKLLQASPADENAFGQKLGRECHAGPSG
jgi:hypothetical protein